MSISSSYPVAFANIQRQTTPALQMTQPMQRQLDQAADPQGQNPKP